MRIADFNPSALDEREVQRRRLWVLSLTLLFTAPAALLMADLHWHVGYDLWRLLHLILFVVLFSLLAFGAVQALLGYVIRRRGGDPFSITNSVDFEADTEPLTVPVAIIMPICNEEVRRVMEGVRAIFESVRGTRKLPDCDFFLLSDSTQPNNWVAEEAAWLAMTQQLNAHGRMFYRKRRGGINKKAGNVADFCRRWGKNYRYMVVLDADSIMSGDCIVKLVRLMERNRRVGLIQAVPVLVNGETVLSRLQQFATCLYGRLFVSGLNYWQQGEANYWGHNAIVRLAPFIRHCSLPELPGDGPFGGRILSHDYVEAALLRRAGWQVWLATDLDGSFEECPPNVIDLAKRDRRWLQGNLQHARLIVARGFHVVNRLHFTLGILAYLASPLWLCFLVLTSIITWDTAGTPLTISDELNTFATFLGWSMKAEAISVFVLTLCLLFLPKVVSLADLRGRPAETRTFGGWTRLLAGVVCETVVFTLLAPVLMVFHTKFVVLTLARQTISWGSQRRGRDGNSAWSEALHAHWDQTLIGLAAAYITYRIDPLLAAWMSPVLAGLICSIPLSFLTGSFPIGRWFRDRGIFLTPVETRPSPEVERINRQLEREAPVEVPRDLAADYGLLQATLDPYVNAVHLALLRSKEEVPPDIEVRFAVLRQKLVKEGPQALSARDKLALMMDADSMHQLHDEIWSAPSDRLSAWWQKALKHYSLVGPRPETAFTKAA